MSYKLYDKLYGEGASRKAYYVRADDVVPEALVIILDKLERLEKKINEL